MTNEFDLATALDFLNQELSLIIRSEDVPRHPELGDERGLALALMVTHAGIAATLQPGVDSDRTESDILTERGDRISWCHDIADELSLFDD